MYVSVRGRLVGGSVDGFVPSSSSSSSSSRRRFTPLLGGLPSTPSGDTTVDDDSTDAGGLGMVRRSGDKGVFGEGTSLLETI